MNRYVVVILIGAIFIYSASPGILWSQEQKTQEQKSQQAKDQEAKETMLKERQAFNKSFKQKMLRLYGDTSILSQLNLSTKQKETISLNKSKERQENIELSRQIRLKEKDLDQEIYKLELDQNTIKQLVKKIADLKQEQVNLKVKYVLELRKILNDEQYKKYKEIRDWMRVGTPQQRAKATTTKSKEKKEEATVKTTKE